MLGMKYHHTYEMKKVKLQLDYNDFCHNYDVLSHNVRIMAF